MTHRGADLRYGRTLPRTLREAGLVDVAAMGSFPVGGTVRDRLEIVTVRHVCAELVSVIVVRTVGATIHLERWRRRPRRWLAGSCG